MSSSGDLSDRSNVFHSSPRPFYVPFFSILLLMALFGGSVGMEDNGKLASHILLSQRPDPKEKQVINLDQDVQVCGYFWWMVDGTPSYDFSLPCNIFFLYGLYFLFFFFF